MTFESAPQRARAAAPKGGVMKTPPHLEALVKTVNRSKSARKQVAYVPIRRCVIASNTEDAKAIEMFWELAEQERKYDRKLQDVRRQMREQCRRPLSGDFDFLLSIVSKVTGHTVEDILGHDHPANSKARSHEVSRIRQATIRLCRTLWPGFAAAAIARKFRMNHTSVLYALGGCRKTKINNKTEAKISAVMGSVMSCLEHEGSESSALYQKQGVE